MFYNSGRKFKIKGAPFWYSLPERPKLRSTCKRTNITSAICRKRIGNQVLRAEKFGDLITADHKVLSEGGESRNNHRYAVVVQDLATHWIQSYPCKTKCRKFFEPSQEPMVIFTVNFAEFGKACEEWSWNHKTSTHHGSETNGIAERVVRRMKEGSLKSLFPQERGERQARTHSEFITQKEKKFWNVLFSLAFRHWEARCHEKRKSSRDSGVVHDSYSEGRWFFLSTEIIRNFTEKRAYRAVGGEQVARTKLSEAQSELDRQEAKVQCADRALHEWCIQLLSQRMELYRANQTYGQSQREKSRFCTELEMKNRALQEDRMKSLNEIDEFKKMSCAETERAKPLSIDELSTQEKESKCTVNHLMVQIQELQDWVNSLNNTREFFDPDPTFTVSLWVFGVLVNWLAAILACSPIRGNHLIYQETFLPSEAPAAFFGSLSSVALAPFEPVSLNTGRLFERANASERNPQNFAIPTPRSAKKFSTWNPPLSARLNSRGINSQKWMSYFLVQVFPRIPCCGSIQRSREGRSGQWTILEKRISRCLMRRSRLPWRRSLHFNKRVNLEEQKAQMQDRFLHERQIAYMIYEYFRVTWAHEAFHEYTNLFSISLQGDDSQDLDTRWDQALQVKLPKTALWKVCTRCECESLINSEQYWPRTNKKSIEVDQSRIIRSRRPWWWHTLINRSGQETSKSEMIELTQEHWLKTQKGKNVSVDTRQGECHQWKAKGQCSKGDACSFRHDDSKHGKKTQSSSPAPRRH